MKTRRACVVGSGPNGLTAAITLAQAGVQTTILEAADEIGGGARQAALTLPGFSHDLFSAVHPLAACSPVFAQFPLAQFGLEWIQPTLPVAHPLADGSAAFLSQSLEETCAGLGASGAAYRRLAAPLLAHWKKIFADALAPPRWPASPFPFARFGALALLPATSAKFWFPDTATRALFAGIAAHSVIPLDRMASSAAAWLLILAAHAAGWPFPRGGAASISRALAGYFESMGGQIVTGHRVRSLAEIDSESLVLADVTPRQLLSIAADRLPASYCRSLERYRYGPGVFKMDWALSAPIPWRAAACTQAGTVHVGGDFEEVAAHENGVWHGRASSSPFILVAQPTLWDSSRAPQGKQIAWAYCHTPNGSTEDMSSAIEARIERFAPGFRQVILARHAMNTAALQSRNANLVGGDIGGGAFTLKQLFLRPTASLYRTPRKGLYLCSSSTPPGGGVHGMCGYHAARAALDDLSLGRV